jgi:hypothetical protein
MLNFFDFFNKLFKKQKAISTEQSLQLLKDERKAECPYCHNTLNKIPSRKTKCPHCGEFMFVRTRPRDNIRVVVTKEEADKIDEEWTIVNGTHDIYIAEKKRFEKEKEALRKRFNGREPSNNDVEWSLLNKDLIKHAKIDNWGFYRNIRFQMADILNSENKLKEALQTYLEVCYLDLNGPNNIGSVGGRELLNELDLLDDFPPFDPGKGLLAPGVMRRIQRIVKKLDVRREELKPEFLNHNARIQKSLKLPMAPEECWAKIESEIWKQ